VLDGPQAVAKAEANVRGEWALALDKPLPPGTHDLAIRTTSKDEKVTTLSDQRVAVSVPDDKSNDVLVVLNAPDAPSKVLQVPEAKPSQVASAPQAAPEPAQTEAPLAPATPEVATAKPAQTEAPPAAQPEVATAHAEPAAPPAGASEVASAPVASEEPQAEPEPAGPKPAVTVAAVEADTAGGLYVAGTAETGEPVRVYVENQPIGEAKPTENGTWLVETKREMPAGTYDVRADQVDKATGDVIARAEVSFERDVQVASLKPNMTTTAAGGAEVTGEMPKVHTVIIKRGDNLWRIARELYGRGIRYSTIYQANKDQIRNPHWIYPGQVFVVPAGNTDWQK
jgi:nucleoid-associated protein YgaU